MKELRTYKNLTYMVQLPDDCREGTKYPTIMTLHGVNGCGTDRTVILNNAMSRHLEELPQYSFVIIAPQCPMRSWFDTFDTLLGLVDFTMTLPFVDPTRTYLAGFSNGGFASWRILKERPDTFAAAVICCGGGKDVDPADIDTPVWAYHGADDQVVLPIQSRKMIDGMLAAEKEARLTILNGVAHPVWNEAYSTPETYDFLLAHRKNT